jgi:hypothetical protein
MNVCDGSCEDSDSDAEHQNQEFDEDDIDGRAGFYEGDGHEFGPEPYGNPLEQWACPGHEWKPPAAHPVNGHSSGSMECHRCFKTVINPSNPVSKDADTHMAGYTTEPGWPSNMYGEPAWQCIMGHHRCERCPKLPPPHRLGDDSWEVRCDCPMTCDKCAVMKKEKEKEIAWECSCGMVVCGECKATAPTRNPVANAWAGQETRMAARAREDRGLFGRDWDR